MKKGVIRSIRYVKFVKLQLYKVYKGSRLLTFTKITNYTYKVEIFHKGA